jgi:hypothetical protein
LDEHDPLNLDANAMHDDTREVFARKLTATIAAERAEMANPRYAWMFEKAFAVKARVEQWLTWAEEHIRLDGQSAPFIDETDPGGDYTLETAEYFLTHASADIRMLVDEVEDKASEL